MNLLFEILLQFLLTLVVVFVTRSTLDEFGAKRILVKVVDSGCSYSKYKGFMIKYFPEYFEAWENQKVRSTKNGKMYIVLGSGQHQDFDRELFLIQNVWNRELFIIERRGVLVKGNGFERYLLLFVSAMFAMVSMISTYIRRHKDKGKYIGKYAIGSIVKIINGDKIYPSDYEFIKENFPSYYKAWKTPSYYPTKKIDFSYKVIGCQLHECDGVIAYLIKDLETSEIILIGEDGICEYADVRIIGIDLAKGNDFSAGRN